MCWGREAPSNLEDSGVFYDNVEVNPNMQYTPNFNVADQSAGNRIESNVFRERPLTVEDEGTTITFGFDFKRGNINAGCP